MKSSGPPSKAKAKHLGIALLAGLSLLGLGSLAQADGLFSSSPQHETMPGIESAGPWMQPGKITPDDAHEPGPWGPHHAGVRFGAAVDLDGSLLAVGTSVPIVATANWVYIFERADSGEWTQVAKIDTPDATTTFGHEVTIDEKAGVLVVGDRFATNGTDRLGKVFIYEEKEDNMWERTATFEGPPGPWDGGTGFGWSLAIEGTTIAVGAHLHGEEDFRYGSVHIIRKTDADWKRTAFLTPHEPQTSQAFGFSVALDSGALFVGSPHDGEGSVGAVHVYQQESEEAWVRIDRLEPPDPGINGPGASSFGFDVDADRDVTVVGDTGWTSVVDFNIPGGSVSSTGKAYVFKKGEETWELTGELQAVDQKTRAKFGYSVAIDEDIILIGAPGDAKILTGGRPLYTGAGYVFEETGGEWIPTAKLYSDESVDNEHLGYDVALDGGVAVLGAPHDTNRRDGTPYPMNNLRSLPPPYAAQSGVSAGSAYVFEHGIEPRDLRVLSPGGPP